MARYLSLDWIDDVAGEAKGNDGVRDAADGRTFAVTEVVTGGPEGDVTYHLAVKDGLVSFAAGPAEDEDVRFVQDWGTAVAVATGELNAQEAFLKGRIKLVGDQQSLFDNQPVFAALDAVFRQVRPRTDYA
jgi:putative sterol carrier protein